MGVHIGKIIKSENHVIYWAQVENNLEGQPAPTPNDCAFGNFVKIEPLQVENITIVGLIIDTMLIDRDSLRAGPRLAPDFDSMKIMYPDFIDERLKVVKVLLIGYFDEHKLPYHSFPDMAPNLNDSVLKMDDQEIEAFHVVNGDYRIGYYSAAIGAPSSLVKPLFLRIIPRLIQIFPEEKKPILRLLRNNLEFKIKMEGGFA